jgi:site-specific DNA-methyltransferase (adenine-specific)
MSYKITTNTIYNDDCLDGMKYIKDGCIDMILCDLPYGSTKCKWDSIIPLTKLWIQYKRIIKCKGAIVLTGSQPFTSIVITSNLDGFKYCWVWEKNRGSNFASTKYQPMKEHEDIMIFCNETTTYNPQPTSRAESGKLRANYNINASNTNKRDCYSNIKSIDSGLIDPNNRCPRSIIKFNTEVGFHPTQKPVNLFEYLIKTYTNENEIVLDNCIGSGTTAIACINTNRKFVGFELDPTYFEIASNRIKERMLL